MNKRQSKPKGQSRVENQEKLVTQGTQDEGAIKSGQSRVDNPEWTIKSGQSRVSNQEWQSRVDKGQSVVDNQEKMVAQCTQDEGAIKSGQSRETGNVGYTRRRGNQEWTIHF